MKKITLIYIIVFFCFSYKLFAQYESIDKLKLKSPEVYAFEKYGKIPVGTYTGTPNISIPIYTVRSGDLELPITLDYIAQAIKVDQEATWVGLNWLLNSGGTISTYIKRGVPLNPNKVDKREELRKLYTKNFPYVRNSDTQDLNGYEIRFLGNHAGEQASEFGGDLFEQCGTYFFMDHYILSDLVKRGSNPIFTANFMGYSFEYIYHPIEEKYVIVGKDQRFIFQENSLAQDGYFVITDAKGIKYYFGDIESISTYSQCEKDADLPIPITYWLTKIENPNGRKIELRYRHFGSVQNIIKATESVYSGYVTDYSFNPIPNCQATDKSDGNLERTLSGYYDTENAYLAEIESDDALLKFNVSGRIDMKGDARKLDNIEVYDKLNNQLKKRFVFSYDYYTGNGVGGEYISDYYKYFADFFNTPFNPNDVQYTNDQLTKRLKLVSLKEEGFDQSGNKKSLNPYEFIYNSSTLPGKTSASRDYWGNYNGKENAGGKYYHTLLPDIRYLGEDTKTGFPIGNLITNQTLADSRLNPDAVGIGMISRINYPTGGYTAFTFEPHEIYNYPQTALSPSEPWSITQNLESQSTNFDKSIPQNYLIPKDFILTQTTTLNVKVQISNPASYSWNEMVGSSARLFKYTTIRNPNGTVIEILTPVNSYELTQSTVNVLTSSDINKEWNETITLNAGKYRIQTNYTGPDVGDYDFPLKGLRQVKIQLSSNVDLLKEYKLNSVYTMDTDQDMKYSDVDLLPKEFIIQNTTPVSYSVILNIDATKDISVYNNSKAVLKKEKIERNVTTGRITVSWESIKEWSMSAGNLLLNSEKTQAKVEGRIGLDPGRYKIGVSLPLADALPTAPEFSTPGSRISFDIRKYIGTVSGETVSKGIGVRIKQITNFDGKLQRSIKYRYYDNGMTTGLMMNKPVFSRKKIIIKNFNSPPSINVGDFKILPYWVLSSDNLMPSAGIDVGYGYVETINDDLSFESLTYINGLNFIYDFCKPLVNPRNGNLYEHKFYNSSGSIVKLKRNSYTVLKSEPYFINTMLEDIYVGRDECASWGGNSWNPYALACPYGRLMGYIYPSINYWMELTKEVEELYTPQGIITQQTEYTYNPLNLALSSSQKKTSNSKDEITYITYPSDYVLSEEPTYPGYLVNNHILNTPIEIVKGVKSTNNALIITGGTINKYDIKGNMIENLSLEIQKPLSLADFKFSNKNNSGILPNASTGGSLFSADQKYQSKITANYQMGNLIHFDKSGTENITYIWSYNYQYPVAEIVNATYTEVSNAIPGFINYIENAAYPSDIMLNSMSSSLRTNLPNAQVTTYTYKPLVGISSKTDPRGITTYYDYDGFGRLISIKDKDGKILQNFDYHYSNQ